MQVNTKVKIAANSRYAPIRYEATRPYAQRFGKLFAAEAAKGATRRVQFIKTELLPLIIGELKRMGAPEGPGPGQGELSNVQIYSGYLEAGRVIFDVHNELSKSLTVTDCRDIPCEALSFPMKSFYLYFGKGSGLVENGMEIEGAFVHHLEDEQSLLIDLVPTGAFAVRAFWQLPMGEQLTGVSIRLDRPTESITAALDRSVDETIERNNGIFKQLEDLERQLALQYGQPVTVPAPVMRLADKRDLLHRALQLVVNTLFFINAVPDDVVTDWEEAAPADLLLQLKSDKFGTRKTAENNLANQGYVKVKFIGRHYANSIEAKTLSEALSTGRVMPTHLRRGHFRSQPYGPERGLRRTVFIAPIVVNPGGGDAAGRIYQV